MLDLQKYLAMAEADPGFRARLFENANQAIKDEFGEDLPYKLKCREKLVFEIEPMEGLLESTLEAVAGGAPPKEVGYCFDGGIFDNEPAIPPNFVPLNLWEEGIKSAGYTLSTQMRKGDEGFYKYYNEDEGFHHSHGVKLVKLNGQWYADVK